MHFVKKTVLGFLVALLCGAAWCGVVANGAAGLQKVDSLARSVESGSISVQAKGALPGNAAVSLVRTQSSDVRSRILSGLGKRKPSAGGSGARLMRVAPAKAQETARQPAVLAMYDITIAANGAEWQPSAGSPAKVSVVPATPIFVAEGAKLALVHLADDGSVETLPESRCSFKLNAAGDSVEAFEFSAEGFSVYAIVDENGAVTGRRLYDFYSLSFDKGDDPDHPLETFNTYVPRYFTTVEGNKTFRQIVKSGEKLVRPEVLPSPLGRTFIGWFLYNESFVGTGGTDVDGVEYDEEGYAKTKFDFTKEIVFESPGTGMTEENHYVQEFVLRARFAREGFVIFHEQPVGNNWPITAVRRVTMQVGDIDTSTTPHTTNMVGSVKIDDIKVTYDDTSTQDQQTEHVNATPKMMFRGWSLKKVQPGKNVDEDGNPFTSDDILKGETFTFTRVMNNTAQPRHLYPVFVDIHWLSFKAAESGSGASYVPPHYYYADEGATEFTTPTRIGYTFTGWYTEAEGGVKVGDANGALVNNISGNDAATLAALGAAIEGGKLMLTKDVTLYGHWDPAETRYSVVIWKQKATDAVGLADSAKQYDFSESVELTGNTLAEVGVPNAYLGYAGQAAVANTHEDYVGFHLGRYDAKKVIAGDGSMALNVYYDRNEHTLTFQRVNNYISSNHTITALYGASIKENFPIAGIEGIIWEDSNKTVYDYVLATLETMPDANVTFTGEYRGDSRTIYYYVEVDEQTGETFNGKYYSLYKTVKHKFNFLTFNEEFHPISGYITLRSNANPAFGTYNNDSNRARIPNNGINNLYYDRDEFSVTFVDSESKKTLPDGVKWIKFERAISSYVPDDPVHEEKGYNFTGWYADSGCSTRVFFTQEEYDNYNETNDDGTPKNKVLYDRMPAHNLRVFAGWEAQWFLIQIDPNGGQLMKTSDGEGDSDSLWFWETLYSEKIHEYTATTRSFVESLTGKYFYAMQSREKYGLSDEWVPNEPTERGAYYTTDQNDDAIVDRTKRYEPAINAFRYAGWYEVIKNDDGTETEELYKFGQPVDHDTTLRLHWKKIGTYMIQYRTNIGTLATNDVNETTFEMLDGASFADDAELIVTRTAVAPDGYSFSGWTIRNGDGRVYHPGEVFLFNSLYTVTEQGPDGKEYKTLILDAVYNQVATVKLTTDANGGTIDTYVATTLPLAYPDAPSLITNFVMNVNGTLVHTQDKDAEGVCVARSVSGMRNNAYGHLSDGKGYTCTVKDVDGNDVPLTLKGWNTQADGTGKHYDLGALVGVDTLGTPDGNGENILYAEWEVKVYYDVNNADAAWYYADGEKDAEWKWTESDWTANGFVWDPQKGEYYYSTTLNGYAKKPGIVFADTTASDGKTHVFNFWSPDSSASTDSLTEYDFSTPVTGLLTLYARWSELIEVEFHPVESGADANGNLKLTLRDEWISAENNVIKVGNNHNENFSESNPPTQYVTPDDGYTYAFACVAGSEDAISEENKIVRLFFNAAEDSNATFVEYANGVQEKLVSGKHLYFVYFKNPAEIAVGYKKVDDTNGNLDSVLVSASAPGVSPLLEVSATGFAMADHVSDPLDYPTTEEFKFYAFAIGKSNASKGSDLQLITASSSSQADKDRPVLLVKNTWRGFAYATQTDSDGNPVWVPYGFEAQLYVIYFKSKPTIVTINEKTIGTEDDVANEKFEYKIEVRQITETTTWTRTRTITGGYDYDNRRMAGNNRKTFTVDTGTYANKTYYFPSTATWSTGDAEPSAPVPGTPEHLYDVAPNPILSDGGTETITLFSNNDSNLNTDWPSEWGTENISATRQSYYGYYYGYYYVYTLTQTQTRTTSSTRQVVVITQTVKSDFEIEKTDITGIDSGSAANIAEFAAEDEPTTKSVTFTNTRKELTVPMHVAISHGVKIDQQDGEWRTTVTDDCVLTVPIGIEGAEETFKVGGDYLTGLNKVGDGGILKKAVDDHVFGGIYYGYTEKSAAEEGGEPVAADGNDVRILGRVAAVGFVKLENSEYYGLCVKDETGAVHELGDCELYYVYCEQPKIYYMKELANGALEQLAEIKSAGAAVSMNAGRPAADQGEVLDVGEDPEAEVFTVSVGGSTDYFRVPMLLDGVYDSSLDRRSLAVGPVGKANTADMDHVTAGTFLYLKIVDGLMKWSADQENWGDFSGSPAVYAIYREIGYDLTIKVTVKAADADKARDKFDVTVESELLSDDISYLVSGHTDAQGNVVETIKPVNNVIILPGLKDGDVVTIHSLPEKLMGGTAASSESSIKRYLLNEVLPQRYRIKEVKRNGNEAVIGNDGMAVYMESATTVEFVNARQYSVTFVDENGVDGSGAAIEEKVLLAAKDYDFGFGTEVSEKIEQPATPTKPMDGTHIYRFKDWSPTIGPVTADVVYQAVYKPIAIPSLVQRAGGDDLVVRMGRAENLDSAQLKALEESLLAALANVGIDMLAENYSADRAHVVLNEVQKNGLRLWECLRTGTPVTQKLFDTAAGSGDSALAFTMAAAPVDIKDLGYDVRHVLRKYQENGTWKDVGSAIEGVYPNFEKPVFTIPLLDEQGKSVGASGFYRVVTQIISKYHDSPVVNEIPSINIIGVLEVASGLKNTMTAIPWMGLPSDPDKPDSIRLVNYVQVGQLNSDDKVYLVNADGNYEQWTLNAEGNRGAAANSAKWVPNVTVYSRNGETVAAEADPAEEKELERGTATWVARTEDADKPYFLVGQYVGTDITIEIPAGTPERATSVIIANPNLTAMKVNDIDWKGQPTTSDIIEIYNDKGICYNLQWNNTAKEWGRLEKVYDSAKKRWVSGWNNKYEILPGTGMRYKRTGGKFEISISVERVKESGDSSSSN